MSKNKAAKQADGLPIRKKIPDFDTASIPSPVFEIIKKLRSAGHEAYLVGGCIRDYLLDVRPNDFDIVTDAHPPRVRQLVRGSTIIGRRFKLVHVRRNHQIFDVATYRKGTVGLAIPKSKGAQKIAADNTYGTQEQDALRRDFTINALYFNPNSRKIIDYTGGMDDLKERCLRSIGDPHLRFYEDPVRIIRAIRFAEKLQLTLEDQIVDAIAPTRERLLAVSPARLRDEFIKLLLTGYGETCFNRLIDFELTQILLPDTQNYEDFIQQSMRETDQRAQAKGQLSTGYLHAVLLWPSYHQVLVSQGSSQELAKNKVENHPHVLNATIKRSVLFNGLRHYMHAYISEVFRLQYYLEKKKSVKKTLESQHIRPAVHLLALRARQGEVSQELATYWQERQPPSRTSNKKRKRWRKRPDFAIR